jgi:xanthine dehydrogenase accessory factor
VDNTIFKKLADAEDHHTPVWLATVISVEGSTPVEAGMKMLVYDDGSIAGTIGGGEIERKVIERIVQEKTTVVAAWKYDLGIHQEDSIPTGMVCGGYQEVLIEPLFSGTPLYIFGGGHCGVALSEAAAKAGFVVTVIDDRPEWANGQKHPFAARTIATPFSQIEQSVSFSPECYIVIMTHGHRYDEMVLRQCLIREYRFLGMLGSTKKVTGVLEKLKNDGITKECLEKIYSPVGLDIGSHTPDEIAISILAQMIAVKYGRKEVRLNSNPFISS